MRHGKSIEPVKATFHTLARCWERKKHYMFKKRNVCWIGLWHWMLNKFPKDEDQKKKKNIKGNVNMFLEYDSYVSMAGAS